MRAKKISPTSWPCTIVRFKDGDTVLVTVHLGLDCHRTITVRLANIESWELSEQTSRSPNFPSNVDRARALNAAKTLTSRYAGPDAMLELCHQHPDCYGRYIARILVAGMDLATCIERDALGWRPNPPI